MKVKQHSLEARSHAIDMLQADRRQWDAASHWGPNLHNQTLLEAVEVGSVADRPLPGSPSSISTVAKIVMKKAA